MNIRKFDLATLGSLLRYNLSKPGWFCLYFKAVAFKTWLCIVFFYGDFDGLIHKTKRYKDAKLLSTKGTEYLISLKGFAINSRYCRKLYIASDYRLGYKSFALPCI